MQDRDRSDVSNLRNKLEEALSKLDSFYDVANQIRTSVTRSENFAALRALRERGSLKAKLNARIALIPDLLKLTVMSFAGDLAEGNTIRANSSAIVILALRFPDEEPIFYFRSVFNLCAYAPIDDRQKFANCEFVKGHTSKKTLIFLDGGLSLLRLIPTYVIAPNRPNVQIVTFGFPIRKELEP